MTVVRKSTLSTVEVSRSCIIVYSERYWPAPPSFTVCVPSFRVWFASVHPSDCCWLKSSSSVSTVCVSMSSEQKMVYSDYIKQKILFCRRSGKSYQKIVLSLAEEGRAVTKAGVGKFLQHYKETRTIACTPGSGQRSKVKAYTQRLIEEQMEADDETTGKELQKLLVKNGIKVSSTMALRWRSQLSWTSKSTRYCQMIRDVSKAKRLEWPQLNKDMPFDDIIHTNETTV